MRKTKALPAATVAAAFLASSCMSVQRIAVPEPELRTDLDVQGVVLGEGPDSELFEFSEVHEVRWTETSLVVAGVVQAPGEPDHGQTTAVTFPLAEVDELLVRSMDGTRSSIIVAGVLMGASIAISLLVTGKAQDGVPIGR